MIAVARIMMPRSVVRLSAGRQYMTDELQALCFVAGANSIFIGDVLLTTKNPQTERDANLLDRLGIKSRLDDAKHDGHNHDNHSHDSHVHADTAPAATVSVSGAAAS
jgi:biotin synthase